MNALEQLRQHALSAGCRFDCARASFIFEKKRRRGLTRVLAAAHSVPLHNRSTCEGCREQRKRKVDAAFAARVNGYSARVGPVFRRRGHPDLIVVRASSESTRPAHCRGRTDAEHGTAVDADIERAVANGGRPVAQTDPCALNLLAYLRDELEWQPVAAQVPLYSRRMNFATAIDLLCVGRRDGRLHLVEIKTTRQLSAQSRACYHANRLPHVKSPPMSRYAHHQLQLWAMHDIVSEEMGIALDESCVLRTSPTAVDRYPLHKFFRQNTDELRRRLRDVTA